METNGSNDGVAQYRHFSAQSHHWQGPKGVGPRKTPARQGAELNLRQILPLRLRFCPRNRDLSLHAVTSELDAACFIASLHDEIDGGPGHTLICRKASLFAVANTWRIATRLAIHEQDRLDCILTAKR
jgi:hypothetical protein